MITLADLRTAQNDFLGTAETKLYTEQRRISAINRAIRYVMKRYDITEYTQQTTLTVTNGTGNLPDDFLRPAKLYKQPQFEYLQVDFDRFGYQLPNTYTVKFDTATSRRIINVYPAETTQFYFWYIQLPDILAEDDDTVRFQVYWEEALAAKSVELLLMGSRLAGPATTMKAYADELFADAWQTERSFLQGKEDQRLQSVFEKRSLLWGWQNLYNAYTLTNMGSCMSWVNINSDTVAQGQYGYITNNEVDRVIVTLPATSDVSVGDSISIAGEGAGGWRLAQNSGDQIQFGDMTTTLGAGGYLESTEVGDSLTIVYTGTDQLWIVAPGSQGNITIV